MLNERQRFTSDKTLEKVDSDEPGIIFIIALRETCRTGLINI